MIPDPPPERSIGRRADPAPAENASTATAGAHVFLGAPPDRPIDWIFESRSPDARFQPRSFIFEAVPGDPPVRWEFSSAEPVEHPALTIDWSRGRDVRRNLWRVGGSVAIHAAALLLAVKLPAGGSLALKGPESTINLRQAMPLVEPPTVFTQSAPNQGGRIAREFDLSSLTAPRSRSSGAPRPPGEAAAANQAPPRPPSPSALPPIPAPPKIEPPSVETARNALPPGIGNPVLPPPPPPSKPPTEKPKIALEEPGLPGSELGSSGLGAMTRVPPNPSGVGEMSRSRPTPPSSGGLVVGDSGDQGEEGISGLLNPQSRRNNVGSSLEMMSDPKGVDFRSYLIRVLSAVRKNWLSVLPESVRLGMRGRVVLQFAISREGDVPKLVIAIPSGSLPLDRAAVAGVSASNPFPPLPPEFKGDEVRLQMVFSYNLPKQ